MKLSVLFLCSFLGAVFFPQSFHLQAETPPTVLTLTWDECLKEAEENYWGIKIAKLSYDIAESESRASQSAFFPELAAFIDYKRGPESRSKVGGQQDNYSAGLRLGQSIFAGFKDQGKLAQGQGKKDGELANTQAAYAKLLFELKQAYLNILYIQQSLKLSHETLKHRMENVHLVRLRYEAGRENKGSLLLALAIYGQAKYEMNENQRALGAHQFQLFKLMGRDQGKLENVQIEIHGNLDADLNDDKDKLKNPSFDQLSLKTPEHLLALSDRQTALADIKVAQAAFYPTLNFSSSVERQGSDFFPSDKSNWAVGIDLSWSLFSGKRDTYLLQAARSKLIQTEYQLVNIDNDMREKLRVTHNNLLNSRDKLKVDLDFLEAAKIRSEISRKKYANGLISFEDWNQIENEMVNRQKSLLLSKKGAFEALALWEQIQGKGWQEK